MISLYDMMCDLYDIGYNWGYLNEITDDELVYLWEMEFDY